MSVALTLILTIFPSHNNAINYHFMAFQIPLKSLFINHNTMTLFNQRYRQRRKINNGRSVEKLQIRA